MSESSKVYPICSIPLLFCLSHSIVDLERVDIISHLLCLQAASFTRGFKQMENFPLDPTVYDSSIASHPRTLPTYFQMCSNHRCARYNRSRSPKASIGCHSKAAFGVASITSAITTDCKYILARQKEYQSF